MDIQRTVYVGREVVDASGSVVGVPTYLQLQASPCSSGLPLIYSGISVTRSCR